MHSVIAKTFGGLSASCYARHFIFGLAFPVFVLLMLSQNQDSHLLHAPTLLILVVNTLLYPYSRFVYESVMDFIMGQNVIFGSLMLMLGFKLATMLVCWVFAIFIAPFGLAYLYFHHSKTSV